MKPIVISLVFLFFSISLVAQPLYTGPLSPGNTGNCTSCAGVPWINNPPNWVQFFVPPDSFSTILYYKNFGFAIPASATITGIKVYYAGDFLGPTASDTLVQLTHNNLLIGSNQAMDSAYANLPRTYGDSLNLWGATLTPAIVNDTTFGFGIRIETDVQPINGGLPPPVMTLYFTNAVTGAQEQIQLEMPQLWYQSLNSILHFGMPVERAELSVLDINGKVVFQASGINGNQAEITSELPAGIYIGRLVSDKGEFLGQLKFRMN